MTMFSTTDPLSAPYRAARPWLLPAISLTLLAAFALLTGHMLEAQTQPMDAAMLCWAQQWRVQHPGLAAVMRDFTGVGSTWVLTAMTAALVGYLWITRRRIRAVWVAVSMSTGAVLVQVLKAGIGRQRPAPEFAAFYQGGLSFPSGHASMSAVFFLTLAALLAEQRRRPVERVYVLAVGGLFAGLIGFSRITLGVHWTSDVFAGWLFGMAWAIACFSVVQRFDRPRATV